MAISSVDDMISEQVKHFIKESLDIPSFHIFPLSGGANNQGFKVSYKDNDWFLKLFSSEQSNSLNKMKNEFAFSKELISRKVNSTPKPIALSAPCFAAIYEFVEGVKVVQVNEEHVLRAVDFVASCNLDNEDNDSIPFASESPARLYDFVEIVENRLARFNANSYEQPELLSQLQRIQDRTTSLKKKIGQNWLKPLNRNLLSASDFGFHNAIQNQSSLFFIDFEYAGLDSCWKLLADFYSQPEYPVPMKSIRHFFSINLFDEIVENKKQFLKVFELTQLKWCLIMLNEFLPEILQRRQFAWNENCLNSQSENIRQSQIGQLHKSINYYDCIDNRLIELQNYLQEI